MKNKGLLNKLKGIGTKAIVGASLCTLLGYNLGFSEEKKYDWLYHSMEGSLISLSAADLAITYKGMEYGCREANPIIREVLDNKPLAIGLKTSATLLGLYGFRKVKKEKPIAAYVFLGATNLFYGWVVNHNVGIYLSLEKK